MTRLEIRTAAHAHALFPLLHRSPVLDTIVWEGPQDEASFVAGYAEHGERTRRGEAHEFTIVNDDGTPVGCLSVRPSETSGRGDLGILVTSPHQGRGHGTRAVAAALTYAFERLGWVKAEAGVFVGNEPSRRLFERLGFSLEGTVRRRLLKRGVHRDEWLFGLVREAWAAHLADVAPSVAPNVARPHPREYPASYAAYVDGLVGDDVWPVLTSQPVEVERLLGGLTEERALHRYAPAKWSVKQVVGHLCDNERVFAYRALRFARGDPTPLANFDEDLYAETGRFDPRPLSDLLEEFRSIRSATRSLVRTLDDDALCRTGVARGHAVSVRGLVWVTAGHVAHHLAILRERYGVGR